MQLCPDGRWRYPVCFITNGGGVPEAHKAQQLSQWLGVPVDEQQVGYEHSLACDSKLDRPASNASSLAVLGPSGM
jgi:ribonucleotide monophosphatase NagD (HAD superfamily)